MAKNETQEVETADEGDAPLIDLNDASVKKMMARAEKRGTITIDEINAAIPADQNEMIEDIMSRLSERGVTVVENEEKGDDDEDEKEAEPEDEVDPLDDGGPRPAAAVKKEPTDRTDDPVRMYLREMGAVELLSREGEIAIAKRIEAGRDTMIWGLCESPITFNAIIDWSNALNEGRMQLREIMDLEAMLSKGPTAEQLNETEEGGENAEGEISEKVAGPSIKEEEEVADEPEADANEDDEDMVERRTQPQAEEDDEDNTLSLAQMEETLKPIALEKFASITSIYKKFSRIQAHRMDALQSGQDFPSSDEKKYQKHREQLTAEVESVQFHNSKIETLVDALYAYNRRLMALGGQMLRLAERHRVNRKGFLDAYTGHELDENWLKDVSGIDKKWGAFAASEGETVERIRSEIADIAQSTGTSLGEFRRIVNMVQK
ncbi:MAG TPA: sigma-70 factor domain-containing protein, partial [Sphingomicrobium sp.]